MFPFARYVLLLPLLALQSPESGAKIPYSELTAETLIREVTANNPSSTELVQSILPTEILDNVVYFPYSRSTQETSLSAPRVVFFNEDASLRLGLSKDGTLEISDFDFSTSRFRYYQQIGLRDTKKTKLLTSTDCLRCHAPRGSKYAHPIWDDKLWPEAWERAGSALEPFNFDHYFRQRTGFHSYIGKPGSLLVYTCRLNELNARRVARQIAEVRDIDLFKTPLLHALVNAPLSDILKTLPPSFASRTERTEKRYAELREDTLDEFERGRQYGFLRWMRGRHRDTADKRWSYQLYQRDSTAGFASVERTAKVRIVLELIGEPTLPDSWSLIHHDPEDYRQFVDNTLLGFLERDWPTSAARDVGYHTVALHSDRFFADGDWWNGNLNRFSFSGVPTYRAYDFGYQTVLDSIAKHFLLSQVKAPPLWAEAVVSELAREKSHGMKADRIWEVLEKTLPDESCPEAIAGFSRDEKEWGVRVRKRYEDRVKFRVTR